MEPSTPESTRVPESRALTGLRGLGALLVMAHHLYLRVGLEHNMPFLQWGLRKGYLGVDLFFVLSGFVLSMVYGPWFKDLRPGMWRAYPPFLVRRVARVWPLHAALVLALLWLRWALGDEAFSARVIVENLAMVQAWGFSTEINTPAWSISTEFMAYLLFPLLAACALRGTLRPVLTAACVAAMLWACIHFAPPLGPVRRGWLDIYYNYSPLPMLRSLAGFLVGMLAWRAGRSGWVRRVVSARGFGTAALLLLLALMVGRVNDVLIFLLMPWLVLAMHHGGGRGRQALSSGPLHGLGVISYSVYLVHFPLLNLFLTSGLQLRYMLPGYVLTTIGVAAAAYLAVERPGRSLMRAMGDRALRMAWSGRARLERGA